MPLPEPAPAPHQTFHCPQKVSHPFSSVPSCPGMKPAWLKCHLWLHRHRLGEGNQAAQHQNDPDKMLKLTPWGLHPRKGFIYLESSSAAYPHQG